MKTSTIGRRISPAHSAEILRDEFLRPMKTSVYELANALKVPRTCANDIVLAPLRYVGSHCDFTAKAPINRTKPIFLVTSPVASQLRHILSRLVQWVAELATRD